jgi:hypothetical protein
MGMNVEEMFSSRVSVPKTTLFRGLPEGESVLLSMTSERYFSLDRMGTEMWAALTTAKSIGEAYRRLLSEYDVDEERLRADLKDLLQQLTDQGLVEIDAA